MSMCDRMPSYLMSPLLIKLILVPACGMAVAMAATRAQAALRTSPSFQQPTAQVCRLEWREWLGFTDFACACNQSSIQLRHSIS